MGKSIVSAALTSLVFLALLVQQQFNVQNYVNITASVHGGCATSATTSTHSPYDPVSTATNSNATITFQSQCKFFLAESAIPRSGLGVFTAIPIPKGQPAQPTPDICQYVTDAEVGKTEIGTHTWQDYRFGAQFETDDPSSTRAACEGLVTLFNSMPREEYASAEPKAVKELIHTPAGLRRDKSPGAGAITHYYGASSRTLRDVPAGSELLLWDGTWDEAEEESEHNGPPPIRSLEWLAKHGICVDNLRPGRASDRSMGRGAFATRDLPKGVVVTPSPLQVFRNREEFAKDSPEKLFVNYCFQPRGSSMLLYPYGPNFGLINHSHKNPNVKLRWSHHFMNHEQWLDLPREQFWKMQYPGSMMVEVVALRDIEEGEEIFIDYGIEWEVAWKEHVDNWKPAKSAKKYVYPTDVDRTKPFRTKEELKKKPYARNLMTVCDTYSINRDDGSVEKWRPNDELWPGNLVDCEVIERKKDEKGRYIYTVSLWNMDFADQTYIDTHVPQEAISFVDKPYASDQHLKNAFRHPLMFPDDMTPESWRDI